MSAFPMTFSKTNSILEETKKRSYARQNGTIIDASRYISKFCFIFNAIIFTMKLIDPTVESAESWALTKEQSITGAKVSQEVLFNLSNLFFLETTNKFPCYSVT